MTNDINKTVDLEPSSGNLDNNTSIQQQEQIINNKFKQYENDVAGVNTGCLYQLFAPFLLLFGIVPSSQHSIVDVKPPTRDETSSLLIGGHSDSEDDDDDYDLYNNPSNIDDQIDESRIIRQEKTILDHKHGGLSHHDELESYLNQSLENATSILHKDEQTVYSKFKDTSYRNIHRESTGESTRQNQQHSTHNNKLSNEIEQDKFMQSMNNDNLTSNHQNSTRANNNTEKSLIHYPNTTQSNSSNLISEFKDDPTIQNSSTVSKIPTNDIAIQEPLSQNTPTITTPITHTKYEDDDEEDMSFGQFQQHYEDDSEDDIEISYQ